MDVEDVMPRSMPKTKVTGLAGSRNSESSADKAGVASNAATVMYRLRHLSVNLKVTMAQ